jgi:hypothetical protein
VVFGGTVLRLAERQTSVVSRVCMRPVNSTTLDFDQGIDVYRSAE